MRPVARQLALDEPVYRIRWRVFPGVVAGAGVVAALSAALAVAAALSGADAEAGLELGGMLLAPDAEVLEAAPPQAATTKEIAQATATARTTA